MKRQPYVHLEPRKRVRFDPLYDYGCSTRYTTKHTTADQQQVTCRRCLHILEVRRRHEDEAVELTVLAQLRDRHAEEYAELVDAERTLRAIGGVR